MADLTLDLDGGVRLRDRTGADLTPRGAMLRAVLTALGTAPGLKLTRSALRALLWPDRMPQQAAQSLNRALADLRAGLGTHRDAITGGQGWIGLDGERVAIRLPRDPMRLAAGLSVRSAAFDDWLARLAGGREAAAAGPEVLRIALPEPGAGGHAVCDVILRDACNRVRHYRPVEIAAAGELAGADAAVAGCVAIPAEGGGLMVQASLCRGGAATWSQIAMADEASLGDAAMRLSAGLTRALMGEIGDLLDAIMSYDGSRIAQATRTLRAGTAAGPITARAMLGFARLAAWVERFEGEDAAEEAREAALDAWRAAPSEPVAAAIAAIVLDNIGEVELAAPIAQRSMSLDPVSGLSLYAGATAHAHAGRAEAAALLMRRAALFELPGLSDAAAAMAGAMTAAAAREERSALHWARRAWLLAPTSRPAMRFVSALAFRAGDEAIAAQALRSLEEAEPGFSAAAMAEPDYPVATLRAAGLLDVAWARHLGGARRGVGAQRRGGGR